MSIADCTVYFYFEIGRRVIFSTHTHRLFQYFMELLILMYDIHTYVYLCRCNKCTLLLWYLLVLLLLVCRMYVNVNVHYRRIAQ
jgi:hypothetical protein